MFTGVGILDQHYQELLQNFRLTVTGPPPVGVRTYNLTQAMNPLGIVIDNAPEGTYLIQESGADIPGYDLRVTPNPPVRMYIIPDTTREVVIQMNNIYTIPIEPLPPGIITAPPESLAVWKVLNFPTGTTNEQMQQNIQRLRNQGFAIVITGPNGFNARIGIDDALHGVVYDNVDEGTYYFSEINATLPGYTLSSSPQMPFRRYVMPTTSGAVTISVTNDYRNIPPEQSPQTGNVRSFVIPILLISVAVVCIGGAEFYRRRNKKKKEK